MSKESESSDDEKEVKIESGAAATDKKKKKKKKKKKTKAPDFGAPQDEKIVVSEATYLRLSQNRKLPSKVMDCMRDLVRAQDIRIVHYINHPACTLDRAFAGVIEELEVIWRDSFRNMSTHHAKELSSSGREGITEVSANCLVYGEVDFTSLAQVFIRNLDLTNHTVFYDVGSGSGRGVIAGAILHGFTKLRGIEIIPQLHIAAQQQLAVYEALQEVRAKRSGRELKKQDIGFIEGDFRKHDWSDADVVWANSTCFDKPLMKYLSRQSERMKKGSYFISLTKELSSNHWMLVAERQLYKMSWGEATICCHKKVKDALSAEELALLLAADAQMDAEVKAQETISAAPAPARGLDSDDEPLKLSDEEDFSDLPELSKEVWNGDSVDEPVAPDTHVPSPTIQP